MAGRRIDDHSSWIGKQGKEYPLPEGNKMKKYESAGETQEGREEYPDTSELIHRDQESGHRETKKQKMKTGYRY